MDPVRENSAPEVDVPVPKPGPLLFVQAGQRPAEPVQLGPCQRVVDFATNEKCGKPGKKEIRTDSKLVPTVVVLCGDCLVEHNVRHAEQRSRHGK